MAEIAGTVVGIISLGIQLCRGITWYIDSVKHADTRRSEISIQVEELENILEKLDAVVGKAQANEHLQQTSRSAITTCANAIERIKASIGPVHLEEGSKLPIQARKFRIRLSHPFKQSEISHCKEMLHNIQQNLQSALSAVQIEQAQLNQIQLLRQSNSNRKALHERLDLMAYQHKKNVQALDTKLTIQDSGVKEGFLLVESSIQDLRKSVFPVAEGIPSILETLVTLASDVNRLSTSIEARSPAMVSMSTIGRDVSEIRSLTKHVRAASSKGSRAISSYHSCDCKHHKKSYSYSLWPFELWKSLTRKHRIDCPHSIYEDATTQLGIQLNLCSLMLKRKVQISVFFSQSMRGPGVSSNLRCHRIVTSGSPAFKLVFDFLNESISGPNSYKDMTDELFKLFQLREASPHDRLEDGMTLLHYFCFWGKICDDERSPSNWLGVVDYLLKVLGDGALEKDISGRNCVEYLHQKQSIHNDILVKLLDYGIPAVLSMKETRRVLCMYKKVPLYQYSDTVDYPETIAAILSRSESGLQELIDKDQGLIDVVDDFETTMYELATNLGWRQGCEVLRRNNVSISRRSFLLWNATLLELAVISNDLETLRFWLEIRDTATSEELQYIGGLEGAWNLALTRQNSEVNVKELLSALVSQRTLLCELAEYHLPEEASTLPQDRLLDASAIEVWEALCKYGINPKPSLRPSKRSVYHIYTSMSPPIDQIIDGFDKAFEAGFKDVKPEDFQDCGVISPLFFIILFTSWKEMLRMDLVRWFVSKGADLYECWPNSDCTTIHRLGWRVGSDLFALNYLGYPEKASRLFSGTVTDSCTCSCSGILGCRLIHALFKDMADNDDMRSLDEMVALVLEEVVHDSEHNDWLVAEFLRAFTFYKIGLRHTCCDISRLKYWANPDNTTSPTPQYQPDELREIMDEDAELTVVLERLVAEFGQGYAEAKKENPPLADFYRNVVIPRTDVEVKKLEREDQKMFARGRRDMGVVIEVTSDDENEYDDDTEYQRDEIGEAESTKDKDEEEEDEENEYEDAVEYPEEDLHEDDGHECTTTRV